MPIELPPLRSVLVFLSQGALAGLLVASGACGASMDGASEAGSASDSMGLVGNPAPDFSVASMTGSRGAVSLKGLRGNVVLVDFWGTYCLPCKHSFPKLQELNAAYSARGLHVVGISEDEADDKGKIATFADTYGAKFTIGWDEDRAIARRYKPDVMPSTYVIDKKGVVRFAHVGYHDGDEISIRKEIESLLAQ